MTGTKPKSDRKPSRTTRAAAPLIAGVRLAMRPSEVVGVLNPPASVEHQGRGLVWRYPLQGVALVVDEKEGLIVIVLTGRVGGDVEGVRVGDSLEAALAKLGPPADRRQDGEEQVFIFDRGSWRIGLTSTAGVVDAVSVRERTR